eukprot:UN01563
MIFIRQASLGLLFLHGKNIVHRDVAARNFLLGEGMHVVVTDFGRVRERNFEMDTMETKQSVGPVRWMSFESIKRREYSFKSDVWMFGVFMWDR